MYKLHNWAPNFLLELTSHRLTKWCNSLGTHQLTPNRDRNWTQTLLLIYNKGNDGLLPPQHNHTHPLTKVQLRINWSAVRIIPPIAFSLHTFRVKPWVLIFFISFYTNNFTKKCQILTSTSSPEIKFSCRSASRFKSVTTSQSSRCSLRQRHNLLPHYAIKTKYWIWI